MAKRLNGTGTPRGKGRPLAAGALSGIWLATLGWAAIDLQDEQVRSSERLSEDLFRAADVVERLFQADQRDIDGVLARLRTELRAKNVWNVTPPEAKARDELAELTKTGRRDGEEIDDRRLEAVLRRAFEGSDRLASLEVVVAGHAGLTVVGVERTNEGPRRIQRAREERDGIAKALWYAEEVSRAVASAGRRVERGEIGFEGEIERPLARAVIGLHEPGELEQGVLVASSFRV